MKLEPLLDRIVIEPTEPEKTSSGGIVIPGNSASATKQGKVVAVGPGAPLASGEYRKLTVKKKDRVIYNPEASTEVTDGESTYFVVREADVYVIVKP